MTNLLTRFMRCWVFAFVALCTPYASAAENIIWVTADGIRWQEVFRGLDSRLLDDEIYTKDKDALKNAYWRESALERRELLMPFLWNTIAIEGAIIGDVDHNSTMQVSNGWRFSYPGYNEILTGKADPKIDSNDKIPNANITVPEWLNQQSGFRGRVAAFGSWDVFPSILNVERSGLDVNAGFMPFQFFDNARVRLMNELQRQTHSPWRNVRLDVYTHNFAKEYLRERKPRMLYIAYGESDDFAHDGRYDHYVEASHRFDAFVRDLWETVQSMPEYRDKTNLVILTDHGRGEMPLDMWQHHASKKAVEKLMPGAEGFENGVVGSEHIWMAAMGPDIKATGLLQSGHIIYQNQAAATVLGLMGIDYLDYDADIGKPVIEILK